MRVFWAVLGVLMLAAAGYLFMSDAGGALSEPEQEARGPAEAETPKPAPVQAERVDPSGPPVAQQDVPPSAPPANIASRTQENSAPAGTEPEVSKPAPAKTTEDSEPPTPAPAPAPAPKPETEAPEAPPAPEAKGSEMTPAAPAAEAKLVTNEDGSVTVDGKFTMRGKGTPEEPYVVSWEHLVSVQEDYSPKEGRNTIPPRVSMLDGKHVQIVGNVAFPMMMDEAEECLVMLNQWDGCCIGIPPTPYDAIEVKLKHVVTGNDRLTTYGSITGKLKVDPHLVGGWLVGLYVMDNATLKPQAFGGFAP